MKKTIKHILVIRFRRVGDSVLATSLCSSLKKSFPEAQVDFVLNDNIISLYDNHPDIDRIISFNNEENHSIRKYLLRVRQVMRETDYDVIIDMRSTIKTLWFSLFSLHTPYRIGTKKRYNFLIHNHRIDNHKDNSLDMVQHNLALLKPLEKESKIVYDPAFRLYVSKDEKSRFRSYMEQQGIDFSKPVILASVVTRVADKMWSLSLMKEVLFRIIDKYEPQIIFNYTGTKEEELAKRLFREMECDSHLFVNIQADALSDLRAMIANCDFFFGNEGGPRHIVQALDIPSYAIYSPGISKSVWLPEDGDKFQGIEAGDNKNPEEVRATADGHTAVSVDEVWSGVSPMLDKYLKK
ncbi:glycosyltransferase family 9 protein [Parabacteroides sp. AM08-6]|uniref:glycosyltransferase family 9 protein n=1 Tax=Parabacteroides sp. AM08-6 TaxID=2292053 RepID=UPI000EFE47C3|nr:glycosyltransferase family 9 protein [Parabacteroides sp. AM08-6]RHJ84840.1 lipopolysaccharide heptosyltransferase family protein [Parabacteroides sp. AM08-6]